MNLYAYPGGFFYLLCSFRYFVLRLSLTIKSGVAGWCSILRVLFCIWLQLIVYVRFLLWFSWSETNMLLDGTYASEIMSINSSPFVRSNNWMPREFVVCNITRFATGSSSIKTGLKIVYARAVWRSSWIASSPFMLCHCQFTFRSLVCNGCWSGQSFTWSWWMLCEQKFMLTWSGGSLSHLVVSFCLVMFLSSVCCSRRCLPISKCHRKVIVLVSWCTCLCAHVYCIISCT